MRKSKQGAVKKSAQDPNFKGSESIKKFILKPKRRQGMKKLSVVVLVALLVSMVTYGADYWYSPNPTCIQPISGYTHVGIGTSNPSYSLDVNGTVRATGNSYFSSKVGIGTLSPAEKLHVNGSIRGNQSGALRINTGNGYLDIGPKNTSYAHFYTDRTKFFFNHEIRVDGGKVGSFNENLQLRTSGTTRMTILNNNGYVGIGTTSPDYELEIAGNTRAEKVIAGDGAGPGGYAVSGVGNGSGYFGGIYAEGDMVDFYAGSENGLSYFAGRIGIGTTTPGENKLAVNGKVSMSGFKLTTGAQNNYVLTSDANGNGTWQAGGGGGGHWSLSGNDIYYGEDESYGNVGIGTSTPQSKLAVNGTITAKEIIVTEDGWPDFVFSDNYKLMPLDKLEKHIKVKNSLPGIPTEKEVLKDGVKVGEMQAKLLEKIEELTLYVIELKKENEELKERISILERQ